MWTFGVLWGAPKRPLYEKIKPFWEHQTVTKFHIIGPEMRFTSGDHPDGAFWTKSVHFNPSDDFFQGSKGQIRD